MTEVANATSKRSLAGIGRVLVWPGDILFAYAVTAAALMMLWMFR